MTTQEAVQKAYQWAMRIGGDGKTPLLLLYAAKQVQTAVEANNQYDVAHEKIVELVREWRRSRKPGMERPAELLTKMMGLTEDDVATTIPIGAS